MTGEPVESVVVSVIETDLLAVTDMLGRYEIVELPVGVREFHFQTAGFEDRTIRCRLMSGNGANSLDVQLQPVRSQESQNPPSINPPGDNGFESPFHIGRINGNDIHVPWQSPEEMLRGKTPGVRIIRGTGLPGNSVEVLLRGATSINTEGRSNRPLYVVDGVRLGESMVDIDALNIEHVEVLKGAAAATGYGARGANGVILIQTQRGSHLTPGSTQFTARTEFGWNQLAHTPPQRQSHWYRIDSNGRWLGLADDGVTDSTVSPNDRAAAGRLHGWVPTTDYVRDSTFLLPGTDPACTPRPGDTACFEKWRYAISDNPYGGTTYDQFDRVFDLGSQYTNSLSLAYRGAKTNIFASTHKTRETGIVDGMDGYSRRGVRLNARHRIGGSLEITGHVYYSQSTADAPRSESSNPFFTLQFQPVDVNLLERYPPEERRDSIDYLIQPDPFVIEENPLYTVHNSDVHRFRTRAMGSASLSWSPVRWARLAASISHDWSDQRYRSYYFEGYKTIVPTLLNDGALIEQTESAGLTSGSVTVVLRDSMGGLFWTGSGSAGFERSSAEKFAARTYGPVDELSQLDPTGLAALGIWESEYRGLVYSLSALLDYQHRYALDFAIVRSGHSTFGVEERWQTYHRIGGAYRLSDESFWPFDFLPDFRLRYAFGTAGAVLPMTAQYETLAMDCPSGNRSCSEVMYLERVSLGNPGLRPELVKEHEFGIDMNIGGRVNLSASISRAAVEDQVLPVPLPSNYGFDFQWRNAGTLTANTYEAALTAALLETSELRWDFIFVIDRTHQRLKRLDMPPFTVSDAFYLREGDLLGAIYGHRWATNCGEISTSGGMGVACGEFDINDDGYLVPVGAGNSFTDGIERNLHGSTVRIDGRDFSWGLPVAARQVRVDTFPGGQVRVDTTDYLPIGNSQPDLRFSVGNTVRWNQLSIYALFDAQIGGDIYNHTRQWATRDLNVWEVDQSDKPDNFKKPLRYYSSLYDVNYPNSHYVEDATFVKLRELAVSYELAGDRLPWIFAGRIDRVTVSLIGRNVWTSTGYTGFDPEATTVADAGVYRHEAFGYPTYRTFSMSVEVAF